MARTLVMCAVFLITTSAFGQNNQYSVVDEKNPEDIGTYQGSNNTLLDNKLSESDTNFPLVPVIPKECEAENYCENVPNYPHEHVDRLLSQIDPNTMKQYTELFKIENRTSMELSDELCHTRLKSINPEAAKNVFGDWVFILKSKLFSQGFEEKKCRTPRKRCSDKILPEWGYKVVCEQNYLTRRMLSFNYTKAVTVDIPVALGCCCAIEREKWLN